MLFHGETCRHCGANMSEPKPVPEGPRKGQTRTICVRCGHMEYQGTSSATVARPMPSPPPETIPAPFSQPRLFKSPR